MLLLSHQCSPSLLFFLSPGVGWYRLDLDRRTDGPVFRFLVRRSIYTHHFLGWIIYDLLGYIALILFPIVSLRFIPRNFINLRKTENVTDAIVIPVSAHHQLFWYGRELWTTISKRLCINMAWLKALHEAYGRLLKVLEYIYLQYLLMTAIYMLEPWEQKLINR